MKQQDFEKLESLVGDAVLNFRRTSGLIQALADGLDPDSPDPKRNGRTLLFNYHLTPTVAKLLLDAGADASYVDAKGYQPLHSANPKVAALLLAAGADIEARVRDLEMTPLITHAARGDAKMVKFLLDNGADILARWENGGSNDVIGAAAFSATASNSMGGRDRIFRLVEKHIGEGLISRRFKLLNLHDVRR